MAESVVTTVLGNVGDLVVGETRFHGEVALQVATLKHELTRLHGYLRDADGRRRSSSGGATATLVAQIRAMAYEADSVIQAADHMEKRNRLKSGIPRYARLLTDQAHLRKIGAEIESVKSKLSEIFASIECLGIVDLGNMAAVEDESPQQGGLSIGYVRTKDAVMVGFRGDYEEIVQKLVDQENSALSAISIVAMSGAGKTMLLKELYNSSRVTQYFETVACARASQSHKGILRDILELIVEDTDDWEITDEMEECDLAVKIKELLLQKRYLVVLDDLCEPNTWDQIYKTLEIFPDASNGSRIILTTQKEDVANHVKMPNYVHALKPLDEAESWELFSSKALPPCNRSAKHYVHAFEDMGRELTRKCDGLPLLLLFLGASLSRNLNLQTWSEVLSGWPPSTQKTSQIMWYILACSYKSIPDYCLRSCLLYLAAFPKNDTIFVSYLVHLWIVESFIPHTTLHTQEETAYKYVTELAERGLVQVIQTSKAHGRIDMIRISDTVREWCIEEARQDGFLDINDTAAGQAGASSSSSDIMPSYRSSFQNTSDQTLQATTTNLRTLFGFGLSSVIVDPMLKLLRVIHVEDSSLQNFNKVVDGCTHLRYLRLRRCKDVSIPFSIGRLLYLQTIDLRWTELEEGVPNSLWDIPTLRHVYVSNILPGRSVLQSKELQTLELNLNVRSINYPQDAMMTLLGQMKQLTSLTLRVRSMCINIGKILANKPQLVDVSMHGNFVLYDLPEIHHLPQKLRRLHLFADDIKEDLMPILEKLPCLVVLVLKGWNGQIMSCSAQGFPELQELEMETNVWNKEWRIQCGSMPKLAHLKLGYFSKMKEQGLPEALLHMSLRYLDLTNSSLISRDDSTLKELERKGCKVVTR